MIKLIALLKRREGKHKVLALKYITHANRYFRRFLYPLGSNSGPEADREYDVITEIWFDDQESFDKCLAHLGSPDIKAIITADEDRLFDRKSMRFFTVEEKEDPLPQ